MDVDVPCILSGRGVNSALNAGWAASTGTEHMVEVESSWLKDSGAEDACGLKGMPATCAVSYRQCIGFALAVG